MDTLVLDIKIPDVEGYTPHGANVQRQHAVARALRVAADQVLSSGFQTGNVLDICHVEYRPADKSKPRAA